MSNSINLIEKKPESKNKTDLAEKLKKISFIALISLALFSIVIFLLNYRFSVGYVRSQEDKLVRKMGAYEQLGSRVFLLNSRLSDISTLLSTRNKLDQTSASVVATFPSGLKVMKYQVDATGVQLQASSQSLSDINDLLNSLLALTSNKVFTSVEINSLSANALGYSIQLTLN